MFSVFIESRPEFFVSSGILIGSHANVEGGLRNRMVLQITEEIFPVTRFMKSQSDIPVSFILGCGASSVTGKVGGFGSGTIGRLNGDGSFELELALKFGNLAVHR